MKLHVALIFFFANVGASLSNKIDNIVGSPLDFLEQQYPAKLQFEPPQINEVRDIIKNLKNTSAGNDEISSSLFIKRDIKFHTGTSHSYFRPIYGNWYCS